MRISPHSRWRSFPVQVALALLGWAALPGDARAGCGEYVQVLGADGKLAPAMPADHDRSPAGPCHGPTCDRQAPPAAPLAPPAPTTAGPQTQFDAILAGFGPADAAPSAGVYSDPDPVPTHLVSSLFRPPRLIAIH